MEMKNATALLLGGSGLVGMAVARRLMAFEPKRIVITGLTREEVEESVRELQAQGSAAQIEGVWGNIFLPSDLAHERRDTLLADPASRRRLVRDVLDRESRRTFENNLLVSWLTTYEPALVVDCVNTATALAYQD